MKRGAGINPEADGRVNRIAAIQAPLCKCERLFERLEDARPYFYPFKRILLWGQL